MIFLYPVIYMNMPFLAGKMPAGKAWMKLDINKVAQSAGIDTSQLGSLEQDDPSQFLDYLRGSSARRGEPRTQTIDGVPTTHYSATLQLNRILDRLPGAQQAAAKAALEKLGVRSAGGIPVEVWVDAQGRVRRTADVSGRSLGSSRASGPTAASAARSRSTSRATAPFPRLWRRPRARSST